MYSNGSYNKLHVGQNLSDTFLGQNGVRQLDVLSPFCFNSALEYTVNNCSRKLGRTEIELDSSASGLCK